MTYKWDKRFLELAKHISAWSKDPSTKVGAVIVRCDKTIASLGFNGFPKYMDDKKEYYDERSEKYGRIIHAEMNALIHANENLKGCTLYTYPMPPCDRCIVHMSQVGICRIVSIEPTEGQLERWGDSFDKAMNYAKSCNIALDFL